jgi:anti-sigma regulatory factor (Ser/Thr protein kinase)
LRRCVEGIEIEVEDQGEPAPPEKFRKKTISEPDPETIQPGGLGISLMHSAFDDVRFTPGTGKGNRITMLIRQSDKQKDVNDRIAADTAG